MTSVLIGRDHPAEILRTEVVRATESHGGLVLVTGEAGIGKTTLVTGAAEEAAQRGALVLHGTCWDSDSAPGYWPWVQVIRALRRGVDQQQWAAVERSGGTMLPALLGESRQAEQGAEFGLYDAVTTALVTVSGLRPVVVVLDDLHWADAASLRLLEFAARHTWFERLLLVGTYRDVEVEAPGHPLQPLITPLVAKATTVTLTGLEPDDVAALISRTAGRSPDPELVTEVHRRTGGNPFFVEQTARLWHSGGSVTGVAPGVRDALQRRIALLAGPVRHVLTSAAVLGREFHRQVLAAVVAAPVPQVDRLLDQAVTARLVTARGGGMFAFAHDLVRESLYDGLDDAERRGHHADVVAALERAPALTERVLPGELARHAYLAGSDVEPARAVEHLLAAARNANSRLAADEAIEHLRRALERVGPDDHHKRVTVALDLGRELEHTSSRDEAMELFELAATAARTAADPALLARVALTVYRIDLPAPADQHDVELLREAYRALVGGEAVAEIRPDRLAHELTQRVATLARAAEDDDALVFSLWARHNAIWGPGSAPERVTITDELIALAQRTADFELEYFAASFRWVALLEQGDERYLEQFHDFLAVTKRGKLARSEFASSVDQCVIYLLMGRFGESEEFLDRAVASFGESTHPHFAYLAEQLRWSNWLGQGRFSELAELHRGLAETNHPYPRLLEAISAAERGDVAALAELTDPLAAERPYPRDFLPLWLRLQAQLAVLVGDADQRAVAREDLARFAEQWLVSLYGCDISGPVELWHAELDLADGAWDEAVSRFTEAEHSAGRMRARPWSVRARDGLARALAARGAGDDLPRAKALLVEVEREATALGMRHLAQRAREALSDTSVTANPPPSADEFRRDGEVWSVTYAGQTVHLPDAKGLRDLHVLLGRPGVDVPAVRLLNPSGGELVLATRKLGGDAVLDDEAKASYRRRLERLDTEIDRLLDLGDDKKAAELDTERDALLDQLRSAAGLGGRSRRLGDEAERARKTVTARIRDTLRKLDQLHPELAAHLRGAVVTGASCGYHPGTEVGWRL